MAVRRSGWAAAARATGQHARVAMTARTVRTRRTLITPTPQVWRVPTADSVDGARGRDWTLRGGKVQTHARPQVPSPPRWPTARRGGRNGGRSGRFGAHDPDRRVGNCRKGSAMPRLAHGAVPTLEQVLEARNDLASRTAEVDLGLRWPARRRCRISIFVPQPAEHPGQPAAPGGRHPGPAQGAWPDHGRPRRGHRRQQCSGDLHLLRPVRRPRHHPGIGLLHHRQAAGHQPGAPAPGQDPTT